MKKLFSTAGLAGTMVPWLRIDSPPSRFWGAATAEAMRVGLSLSERTQVNWFQRVESRTANVWAPRAGASSDPL